MAKRTYVAQNRICGLEAPTIDKGGKPGPEHVLELGAEYTMDEKAAQPFVDNGSLKLKESGSLKLKPGDPADKPDPAASADDDKTAGNAV